MHGFSRNLVIFRLNNFEIASLSHLKKKLEAFVTFFQRQIFGSTA